MTRKTTDKTSAAKRQARSARIRKNNAVLKSRAKILEDAGFLPRGTAGKIQANVTTGAKGLPYAKRKLRAATTRLDKQLGGYLRTADNTPLPAEQRIKGVKIKSQTQKDTFGKSGAVVSTPRGEYAVVNQGQRLDKEGYVTTRRKSYDTKIIPLNEDIWEEDRNGNTALYNAIDRRLKALQRKSGDEKIFSFYFQVNRNHMVKSTFHFKTAEDLYDYLLNGRHEGTGELRYDQDKLERLEGLVIVTLRKIEQMKRDNQKATKERNTFKPKKRTRKTKPRSAMTERDRQHKRTLDKIGYALRKPKKRT